MNKVNSSSFNSEPVISENVKLADIEHVTVPSHEGDAHCNLTVLFCDIVNSTQMSVDLDSKDLHDLILSYYSQCASIIEKNQGIVLRYVGDCVFAVFGYHLNVGCDAENAVLSGLQILDRFKQVDGGTEFQQPASLAIRITAATGWVFANELIGTGPAQQTEVFGQVPYLAARLKNVAKPNTLVVASSTHDRVCKRFESKDLGNWKLKGFEEPVQAWQITRQKVIENLCETKCAPYGTVIRRPHKTDLKINQKEGYL